MKKFLLLPALLATTVLSAQTYAASWQDVSTTSVGSPPPLDGGVAITTDGSGVAFTVGNFSNSMSIGAFNLTSSGSRDIYVAQYTSSGTVTRAVRLGSAADDQGYSIAYKNGLVYVTGYVNGDGTIYVLDPSASLAVTITQSLGSDVHARSIYSYGTNRLMVGGSFFIACSLPMSSGSISLTASNNAAPNCVNGCYDSFTAIIDQNADFLYAGNPNSSSDDNEIMSICCRNGYIYTTGYFKGDLKWKSTSTTMTAAGVQDAFMASVYMSGSLNQCTFNTDQMQAGSIESQPAGAAGLLPDWKECGYGIAADGNAIYVTGNLNNASTPLFDGSAYSGAGAFVARINYSGSQMGTVSWKYACTNTSGAAVIKSIGYAITLDANGTVFTTGASYGDVRIYGASSSYVTVSANSDRPGFIGHWDASGNILSADAINQNTATGARCEGKGIVADGCNVLNTGWVSSTGSFQAGNLPPESVASTAVAMYVFSFGRDATIANDVTRCTTCAHFPITGTTLSVNGGSGSPTYSWSPGTYLSSTTSATPTYSITTCTATIVNYTVTIINGACTTATQLSLETTLQPGANAGADIAVCPNTSYYIGAASTPGFTYSWAPSTGLTSTTVAQPAFSTTTLATLPITFTVTQTDICGNVTTDQVTVSAAHCRMMDADGAATSAAVYPNPSAGIFTVNLAAETEASDVEFVVTDLAGRVVQQSLVTTAGGNTELDLTGQAKGVYLLSVTRHGVTEVYQLAIE
jgi:hypothetical protein